MEIQSLLAAQLDEVRARRIAGDDGLRFSSAAGILGGLDALQVAGAVNEEEYQEWRSRTLQASDIATRHQTGRSALGTP
jgi:hypothetical protein